jgi:4-hydroxy-3-methylbut-2-enyl diphosphate reductase
VESAIEKVLLLAENEPGKRIFVDGELVHNRDVNECLRKRGIGSLEQDSSVHEDDIIVIRSHGIPPDRRSFLENFGCQIKDCTCPLVRRIAGIIEANRRRPIILLGDRNHVEVKGLCGHAEEIFVCENLDELSQLLETIQKENHSISKNNIASPREIKHWLMLCQSTLDVDFLKAARHLCAERNLNIEIIDTICSATKQRQSGLKALENCDAILVVGGRNSANTGRLFKKIKERNQIAFWIENEGDLESLDLDIYKKIGITAGASTPRDVLENIRRKISKK